MTVPHCDVLIHAPDNIDEKQRIEIVPGSVFVPDHTPRVYEVPKGKNPWDVPPLPPKGDWSEDALYASIGRALSQWERFEIALADLFSAFLSPSTNSMPAQRAYGSIITSRGRIGMVKAAGDAYFLVNQNEAHERQFISIWKDACNYSSRRNEIAHGMAAPYSAPDGPVRGLALLPPRYASNKLRLEGTTERLRETPKYAYTSVEISFFADRFHEIAKPTWKLGNQLYRYFREGRTEVLDPETLRLFDLP